MHPEGIEIRAVSAFGMGMGEEKRPAGGADDATLESLVLEVSQSSLLLVPSIFMPLAFAPKVHGQASPGPVSAATPPWVTGTI